MSKIFWRRLGAKIANSFLGLLLVMAAGAAVLQFVVGDSAAVKGVINRSGVYDHALVVILNESEKSLKLSKASAPLDDPAIRAIINQAYSPQVVQTNAEGLIDGTYRWLDGTTKQPDFSLDLASSNQALVDGVGKYAKARAEGLPPCTPQQLRALQETPEIDVWNAVCLPPGTDIDQLAAQAKTRLREGKILSYSRVTADTFKPAGESKNVFEKAVAAPHVFQTSKAFFWVLLVLCGILAGLIIWFSSSRLRGFGHVGKILTITGVVIVLIGISLYYTKSTILNENAGDARSANKQIVIPLLVELGRAVGRVYLIFGAAVVAIGAPLWIIVRRKLQN